MNSNRKNKLPTSEPSISWNKLFDSISDFVFIQDTNYRIIRANKAFAEAIKLKPEDIVGRKCHEIMHKSGTPWPNCPFHKCLVDKQTHTEEVDDPGIGIPLLVTTSPIFDKKGKLVGSVHIAKDISERKKNERLLKISEQNLGSLLKKEKELSYNLNERLKELRCLYEFAQLVEDSKNSLDILLKDLPRIIMEAYQHPEITCVRISVGRKQYKTPGFMETRWKQSSDIIANNKKSGYIEVCYLEERPAVGDGPFLKEEQNLINSIAERLGKVIERITLAKTVEDKNARLSMLTHKLEKMAMYDSLTRLPNRRYFEDTFQQIITNSRRYKQKFAIMIVDVDNFKSINDKFGHHAGDDVLKKVSSMLKKNIRGGDIVARVGGDEFTIILKNLSCYENGVSAADKLVALFQKPLVVKSMKIKATVSIGITFFPLSGNKTDELYRQADAAMYKAKNRGKNCAETYSCEIKDSYTRTNEIEYELNSAISKNEFHIDYQPIVRIADKHIVGVEALLRWNNSKLGIINPLEFIHIAEKNKLINDIGLWVFNEACKQMSSWNRQGIKNIFLTINISPVQLEEKNFSVKLNEIIKLYSIMPFQLEIELTESAVNEEINLVSKNFLVFCKQIQIRLSIDDFGTGFSSLSRLSELPVNTIKINGAFLNDITHNSKNFNIVKSTISLAKSLSLQAIAECVETAEQAKILTKLGCEMAQGFFYYKPMPAKKLTPILKQCCNR